MKYFQLSRCFRIIALVSLNLLLLITYLPGSPFTAVSPVLAEAEGWYLDGQPILQKDEAVNLECYTNRKVTVSDGMGTGTVTYSPKCFDEGATYSAQVKWTSPPKYMQPGDNITFTMTASSGGTISQASGGIKINNKTLLEVHDRNQPSSKTAYTVPSGSEGSKMEIYVSYVACGLHGNATYNYEYKGAGITAVPATQASAVPSSGTASASLPLGTIVPTLPRVHMSKVRARVGMVKGGPIYVSPDSPGTPPSQRTWVKFGPGQHMTLNPKGDYWAPYGEENLDKGYTIWAPPGTEVAIDYYNPDFSAGPTVKIRGGSAEGWYEVLPVDEPMTWKSGYEVYGRLSKGVANIYTTYVPEEYQKTAKRFTVALKSCFCSNHTTDFLTEVTEQSDTIKVIEGEVEVIHKTTGAEQAIKAGSMITSSQTGFSTVTSFDVNRETGDWDKPTTESVSIQTPDKKKFKVGPLSCFIATAAYGSETAAELDTFRAFRDKILLKSEPGKWFVSTYYYLSPPVAEFISDKEPLRAFVRVGLLDPILQVLKNTQSQWDN
jgi:hypothetical protein